MLNLLKSRFCVAAILSLSMLFHTTLLFANDRDEQFAAAVAAYQNQRYDTAIVLLEAALSGEIKSSEAYNNLGLAYYQKGDLGQAILNFERALRQNRSNREAYHNLQAAKQHIDSNIIPVKGYWMFKAWNGLATAFSSWLWARMLWFFLFAAGAGFILWRYSEQEKLKFWGIRAGALSLLFAFFAIILGFQASAKEFDNKWCIVINDKAGIRTAPSVNGEDIMVISAGVKAQITEEKEDWYRIRLDNGVLGWLPSNMIERI